MPKKRAFLICPVRGVSPEASRMVVSILESNGFKVHWPPRDTQQNAKGLDICSQNMEAIRKAKMVFVIWDGKSEGCLFDLGVAFALNKRLCRISTPQETEGKSFQNVMRDWEYVTATDKFNLRALADTAAHHMRLVEKDPAHGHGMSRRDVGRDSVGLLCPTRNCEWQHGVPEDEDSSTKNQRVETEE